MATGCGLFGTHLNSSLERHLHDWLAAGTIDAATADRIRAYEETRQPRDEAPAGRHRATSIAFGLGGIALAAGILLFVAANWSMLGPVARVAVLVASIFVLHGCAGLTRTRLPALSTSLHAAGTAAFGAAVFLAGQTFHLSESWPDGVLLWALGAVAAWWVLRDWPHVLWVAVLVPAWLVAAWVPADAVTRGVVAAFGLVLLSLAYLSAVDTAQHDTDDRRALARLGAFGVVLTGVVFAQLSAAHFSFQQGERFPAGPPLWSDELAPGWIVALAGPLALAGYLGRHRAWPMLVAAGLMLLVLMLDARQPWQELMVYLIFAIGSAGLVAWGLRDDDRLRVNAGILCFALTLFFFYFASLYDRLGRALGLIGIGLLLIGGGWLLERTRRRLLRRIERTAE